MSEEKMVRLSAAARELNKGVDTLFKKLLDMGITIQGSSVANGKITFAQFEQLSSAFGVPISEDFKNKNTNSPNTQKEEVITIAEVANPTPEVMLVEIEKANIPAQTDILTTEISKVENKANTPKEPEKISNANKGLTIVGKIDLETAKPQQHNKASHSQNDKNTAKPKQNNHTQIQDKPIEKNKPREQRQDRHTENKVPKRGYEENIPKKDSPEKITTQAITKTEETQKKTIKDQTTTETTPKTIAKTPPITTQKNASTQEIKEVLKQETKEGADISHETKAQRIETKADTLKGLTVLGRIELPIDNKGKKGQGDKLVASSDENADKRKKRRKKKKAKKVDIDETLGNIAKVAKIAKEITPENKPKQEKSADTTKNKPKKEQVKSRQANPEISDKEIQDQIKKTLAEMSGRKGSTKKISRHNKRDNRTEEAENPKLIKITEFTTANELASLMDVSVAEVISTCMAMGLKISINQRLDAEAITIIASEFGYDAEFVSIEDNLADEEEDDTEALLETRAPIVTIMGHVDHGKTSLLDYIRKTNVTAKEAGGITQHIGAYSVVRPDGRRIVFLDTPGHEAFTAMRARGAKVTDVAIIVVAADDSVMSQTKEAINHAKVAGVPIIIAINKIDKPNANPERVKEELAKENVLVESWGGTYQDELISAKQGTGIDELLEKVLVEADLLDLKANPNRRASGTIIESSLDKGKGYVCTVLVQNGTLSIGDIILVGSHYGRVRAMYDHLGKKLKQAPPSTPVQVLGLNGAPQAGDLLKVMTTEREAREIAAKREQILREQTIRATKGLTLDEIARRKALGDFKELKLIIKGDVDGSVEALTGSLLRLSTPEISINIIHKGVGQITENDVQLAISAKDTIILGFQVRPSVSSKRMAEQNKIQIKLYSVIYQAIEEIKDAMSGMLAPKTEEVIVGNVEVREVFKISKVGTIAGCYVTEGYIKRNSSIRVIRDGIVILQEGSIESLKRFKEDVTEVKHNYECGLNIRNFNDLKIGDIVEVFEVKEIKRSL